MNDSLLYLIGGLATVFGSGGAAWAGVKASLNGQKVMLRDNRTDVKELVKKVDRLENKVGDQFSEHGQRITRLESWLST